MVHCIHIRGRANLKTIFLYHQWLSTALPTRIKLAGIFGIEKKGPTEVFNDTIKSDGYLLKDIETKITPDSIRAYLVTEKENPEILWNMLIDTVEGRYTEPVIPEPGITVPSALVESPKIYPHGLTVKGIPKKCPYFCKDKETHGKK